VEKDIGLSVGAARIAGQDRSMWMTLRPSAGQAQQLVIKHHRLKNQPTFTDFICFATPAT